MTICPICKKVISISEKFTYIYPADFNIFYHNPESKRIMAHEECVLLSGREES